MVQIVDGDDESKVLFDTETASPEERASYRRLLYVAYTNTYKNSLEMARLAEDLRHQLDLIRNHLRETIPSERGSAIEQREWIEISQTIMTIEKDFTWAQKLGLLMEPEDY